MAVKVEQFLLIG